MGNSLRIRSFKKKRGLESDSDSNIDSNKNIHKLVSSNSLSENEFYETHLHTKTQWINKKMICKYKNPNKDKLPNYIQTQFVFCVNNMKYICESFINCGSFGQLYRVKSDKNNYVVKIMNKRHDREIKNALQMLDRQKDVFQHENIVTFHHISESPMIDGYDFGFVLMDHYQNDLFNVLNDNHTYGDKCSYLKQIMNGIRFLHDNKICHGDLKFENCLVNSRNQVCLCDFGFAIIIPDGQDMETGIQVSYRAHGTPDYAGPEMHKSNAKFVPSKHDVWSFGIMFFVMFMNKMPFYDKISPVDTLHTDQFSTNLIFWEIWKNRYKRRFLSFPLLDDQISFFNECIQYRYQDRANIRDLFNHPWYNRIKK